MWTWTGIDADSKLIVTLSGLVRLNRTEGTLTNQELGGLGGQRG